MYLEMNPGISDTNPIYSQMSLYIAFFSKLVLQTQLSVEKNIPGCHDEKLKKNVKKFYLPFLAIEPIPSLLEYQATS